MTPLYRRFPIDGGTPIQGLPHIDIYKIGQAKTTRLFLFALETINKLALFLMTV